MNRYMYVSLILLTVGFILRAIYYYIGSSIAPDGTLVEPFFLIPLSVLFVFIGILVLIVGIIHRIRSK